MLNNKNPIVTVVITCFNQAHFLSDSVNSVSNQLYSNVELIVIDDGSTDDTVAVCGQFTEVNYFYQENGGLPSARNTGLKLAKGSYITFLDADDLLTPNAISNGLELFQLNSEYGFVYGQYRNIGPNGESLTHNGPYVPTQLDFKEILKRNFIGMHGTVLYKKDAIISSGKYDESLKGCEDFDLYLRVTAKYPIMGHDHISAYYRRYPGSMSTDRGRQLYSLFKIYRKYRYLLNDSSEYTKAYLEGIVFYFKFYTPGIIKTTLKYVRSGFFKKAFSEVKIIGIFLTNLKPNLMPLFLLKCCGRSFARGRNGTNRRNRN